MSERSESNGERGAEGAESNGGPGGTRTPEGVSHLIYSQARLTTSLPTHVRKPILGSFTESFNVSEGLLKALRQLIIGPSVSPP